VNKRDNPYTPGAGPKPPMLAGRDRDLENFQSLIERLSDGSYERSLIYSGLLRRWKDGASARVRRARE
jgi:hypothetical protein